MYHTCLSLISTFNYKLPTRERRSADNMAGRINSCTCAMKGKQRRRDMRYRIQTVDGWSSKQT